MKETKKCPFCGGEILAVAKKCKHCKQFIEKKENKADEITKDIDTSSNTPAIKDKKNQMIVAITIVAFIVMYVNVNAEGDDIVIPDAVSMSDFTIYSEAIRHKQLELIKENMTLAHLRDELLPKLMSGAIDIENIEM